MRDKASTLQKWLGVGAILFVVIYIGAVALTLRARLDTADRPAVIASAAHREQERHLVLPQLLLPMGIVFVLAVSYLLVRRRSLSKYRRLDDGPDGPPE